MSYKKPRKGKIILIFLGGVDYLIFLVYNLKYPYITDNKLKMISFELL